jgi:hypothetical protein
MVAMPDCPRGSLSEPAGTSNVMAADAMPGIFSQSSVRPLGN